jgi:hypothetical protein
MTPLVLNRLNYDPDRPQLVLHSSPAAASIAHRNSVIGRCPMAYDLDEAASASMFEAAAPSLAPELPILTAADSISADEPRVPRDLRPRRRSVARRIKERLVLGVAALALFGAWIWLAPESSYTTSASPLTDTDVPSGSIAAAEATAAISPVASNSTMPVWFSPETLRLPAVVLPPSAPSGADAAVPLPVPRPSPQ